MKAGDLGGYIEFQSTLPRRERLYSTVPIAGAVLFQSTLPRRERRAGRELWNDKTRISIHAPTKGATENGAVELLSLDISIHAPTKGATNSRSKRWRDWQFQSTLPRRERHYDSMQWPGLKYFNPRSHEGSDGVLVMSAALVAVFQSTLPRRERQRDHAPTKSTAHNFNPRSHEGSDAIGRVRDKFEKIFQCTLPRRERLARSRTESS